MKNSILKISVLTFGLMLAGAAHANLIQNGGFETGDFTGWTLSGSAGGTGVGSGNAYSGNYAAAFGDSSPATITQTVSDTAGTSYTLSWWLESFNGGIPNSISVLFGGTQIFGAENLSNPDYVEYSYTVVGTGSDVLSFSLADAPAFLDLDDISLTANVTNNVPDGGTTGAMLGFGLVGIAAIRRKVK
jgi:hypothetical protein